MSNSDSDPEFWTLLQTIAIFVLGAWLIGTGLDWSSTLALSKEGGVVHVIARILVLLLGVVVIILRARRT